MFKEFKCLIGYLHDAVIPLALVMNGFGRLSEKNTVFPY